MLSQEVKAQQTIIIVPSADILKYKQVYLRNSTTFRPYNPDSYVSTALNITIGTGYNTEGLIGVSVLNIQDEAVSRLDLAVKSAIDLTKNTRITVGSRLFPRFDAAVTPFNFNFAHIAQKIPKTNTRFTSGIYIANTKEFMPTNVGVLVGIEQAILHNKFKLAVDWISRNESYAFLGAGIKYYPNPTLIITNAVLIPNGDDARFSFLFSIGKIF